ncbi:hypothetical protein [Paenibacillus sp. R14(2021)]|uniref:hypothetical protein n=1 Tax=Paenibacillus sp. R14(2021) TaxID=2859228 RepID=UPI001C611762|nr:hypothetical protein [Paenibacillus sp. R14(2021)]
MESSRSVKATITWEKDPARFLLNTWITDIIVNYGELKGKHFIGDSWTVPVRITSFVEGTWDTFADVGFLVDEAPWHLLVSGYTFRLWAGKEIATVKIL